MYYKKEEIEKVKNKNLIELLEQNGYTTRKENNGNRVLNVEGGLYVFDKNKENTQGFYWHKYNLKGNAIDFCKEFFKDSYLEAIERLLSVRQSDNKINNKINNLNVRQSDSKSQFILPNRDNNIKQAYSYLVYTRQINKNLVNECIKYGLIRQFKEGNHTYVGFIGKDKENNPQYLMLRSVITGSSFKKEYKNSNKEYGFKIFNEESVRQSDNKINIHIFESPIDLLSYLTIFPKLTLKNNAFLSMGGVSTKTLNRFISNYNPNVEQITICFDNDEAGRINANKIKEELKGKYNVIIKEPIYKDYNEQLKAIILNSNENNENKQILKQ